MRRPSAKTAWKHVKEFEMRDVAGVVHYVEASSFVLDKRDWEAREERQRLRENRGMKRCQIGGVL